MEIFNIKQNKILLYVTLFSIIIFITLFSLINNNYQKKYNNEVNKYISNIILKLEEKYPDISEYEIVEILNKDNLNDFNFKKYGIDKNESLMSNINDINNNYDLKIMILIISVLILFIISLIIYYKSLNKKIDEISLMINKINHKIYDLDIIENSEDELSNLKNELYKTTIMLKKNYEKEKQTRKSIQVLVDDISHQLKTPLTSIAVLLDNILDDQNMDVEVMKSFLKDIRYQIDNMNDLIVALLKTSRFDAGVVKFNKEKINLNNLLNEINKNLEVILDLKDVKLNIKSNANNIINGDYSWEKEAITNIIKNSIEYSSNGSNIDIETTSNSVFTKLIIKDYGTGIKKEELKNIFKRFYKNNTNSNSFGIGLNLAKTIIEKDNGYISVKSTDKGTIFEIKYMKN